MPKTILAATDFSAAADAALVQAAHIASQTGAALHILHAPKIGAAEDLALFFPDAAQFGTAEIVDALAERVRGRLAEIDAPDAAEVLVAPGHPFKQIKAAIESVNPDLLVIGITGESGHRLGTVGGKCVRKSGVDTLLVPAGFKGPFRHVTACVDFSDRSRPVLAAAASIAAIDGGSICALYAHEHVDHSPFLDAPPAELLERLPGVVADRFQAELADATGDCPTTFQMVKGRTYAEAIVRHTNETDTDLVAVGTTGRTALAYMLLGTTAEKVMRECDSPVLAVAPR